MCRGRFPKTLREFSGVINVASQAESKNNLFFFPVGQLKWNLNCGTGIQSGANFAGEMLTFHGRRIVKCSVASQELCPVAGYGSRQRVCVEESNPIGKLSVVGVARKNSAALEVNIGNDMHGGFRSEITQNPFHISRSGEAT